MVINISKEYQRSNTLSSLHNTTLCFCAKIISQEIFLTIKVKVLRLLSKYGAKNPSSVSCLTRKTCFMVGEQQWRE